MKGTSIPAEGGRGDTVLCASSETERTIERALAELWCVLLNRDSGLEDTTTSLHWAAIRCSHSARGTGEICGA